MNNLPVQYANNILLATVLIFCLSCATQKDYITESDYSYTGKFKKYKTFHFTKMSENDSLILKALIEETITSKLNAQGYSETNNKPDLLVTYKVFMDNFHMPGYNQPDIETWVYNDYGERLMPMQEDDEEEAKTYYPITPASPNMTAEYATRKYDMQGGTLLITFYDRKRQKTVWQGYASGVFAQNYEGTERNVKLATAKIFREFRLIADGYVIKRGA